MSATIFPDSFRLALADNMGVRLATILIGTTACGHDLDEHPSILEKGAVSRHMSTSQAYAWRRFSTEALGCLPSQ